MIQKREIVPYKRQTHYYETDQMGIIHHSNYIRYFEEARIDFMNQIGFGYNKMEQLGILSPVLSVSCHYKNAIHFADNIIIFVNLAFFNGIKMHFTYEIRKEETKQICTIGESEHCFVNKNFLPISLKRNYKDIYEIFLNYIEI